MGGWTFVFLSTTDWDSPQFGARHGIAQELGRRGHRVLFVEVARALHSLISDPVGTRRALTRLGKIRKAAPGVMAFTPWPVLPIYYSPMTNAVNQRLLALYVHQALRHLGWKADVLWTYWPNSAPILSRLGERVAVYHCADDMAAVRYPFVRQETIRRMEARLCSLVQVVFARTPAIAENRAQYNERTILLAGGIDPLRFDPARISMLPPALEAIPHPRAGFIGTIDDRLDVALLVHCAKRLPEIQWVLVGPVKGHRVGLEPLEEIGNVHFLPACAHHEVPVYVSGFDVGLIPYAVNDYTRMLAPIKLYEYLAMGKPVVSTPIPYVLREAANVRIAADAEAFAEAVQDALAHPPTEEERTAWRAIALQYSWGAQVDVIEKVLAPLLEGKA